MTTSTVTNKVIDTANFKHLAIAEDMVDTIQFSIPKTYDSKDLSAGTVYSLWVIPGGDGDMTELASEISGDNILASWPLSGAVVSRKGMVEFQLVILVGTTIVYKTKVAQFFVDRKLDPDDLDFTADVLTAHLQSVIAERELAETAADEAEAVLADADFQTVAADLVLGASSTIKIVSTDIADVSTVAEKIADVSIVADGIGDIDRVEDIAADVTAVATIAADVSAVAAIDDAVSAVNANSTNIDAVAANATNINAVAAIDSNVTTVAGIDTEVTALAGKTTEIDALYAEIDAIGAKATVASVDNLAGTGRTTETVKGNADAIALRELLSNKKTTLADNSDTFYPTQKAVKTVTDDHESRIVVLENWTRVKTWFDVQEVVRAGRAEAYFPVGLQFTADWNSVPSILDVIGINHDKPTNPIYTRSLTIQANKILRAGRFSAPEAMYNAVTELSAGTYIFTTNDLQYTFTSTQAVPAGGVIYIKTRSEYVPLALTIYGANRTSIIEDNISVTATTGTDNLSPINDHIRMRYGNNNYSISALRQWLNSESATFTWQPLGLYDMPSSYETAGFINLLDADLQAVIGAVDKQVAKATSDGGGQSLFSDKVFLLSRKEMFDDDEGTVTGESQYAFWAGKANADRIKTNLSGSVGSWWLRSPHVSETTSARLVYTSGALTFNLTLANVSYGLAPACVII